MTSEPVTPAQETVTTAMLAAIVTCATASLAVVEYFALSDLNAYLILTLASFVISGYLVPNLIAYWLGTPLHVIMRSS
jgi:ABC-type thiamin/hydroxymethylpyrimidine transport system permease subunit